MKAGALANKEIFNALLEELQEHSTDYGIQIVPAGLVVTDELTLTPAEQALAQADVAIQKPKNVQQLYTRLQQKLDVTRRKEAFAKAH